MKGIAELVQPIDWDTAPKISWKCPDCGSVNQNYLPTAAYLFNLGGPKWVQGMCHPCEDKAKAQLVKDVQESDKREKNSRIMALHAKASLPTEMEFVKFSQLERRPGSEDAFEVMERIDTKIDRSWLCIMGDNSTGKSRLMAAASNRQNGMLVPTLYLNESLFFKNVRESWDNNSEAEVMSVFKLAEVVMWDEFSFYNFMERSWIYERVYAILEQLAEMDKKVVFCTNIMNLRGRSENDNQSIEGRCGKRIYARLSRRLTRYITMKNTPYF